MSNKQKVLVVDDESTIRRILATRLTMMGYEVAVAVDGEEALTVFEEQSPDLVVLDIMMPKLNGLQVCEELRKTTAVPIIILSALGDVGDRIQGLELGADDYLSKPFSPKELEGRIQAILRRTQTESGADAQAASIEMGPLRVELRKRQAYLNDQRLPLTGMEFDVLELLVTNPGKTVSRSEILQRVWGYSPHQYADLRVVDVNVSRLRSKIGDNPKEPEFIHTDWGTGYYCQPVTNLSAASA
ncbi:MAG: response regulator transcription factor RpaB [Thermosynechococcaceae cyanobacterium]